MRHVRSASAIKCQLHYATAYDNQYATCIMQVAYMICHWHTVLPLHAAISAVLIPGVHRRRAGRDARADPASRGVLTAGLHRFFISSGMSLIQATSTRTTGHVPLRWPVGLSSRESPSPFGQIAEAQNATSHLAFSPLTLLAEGPSDSSTRLRPSWPLIVSRRPLPRPCPPGPPTRTQVGPGRKCVPLRALPARLSASCKPTVPLQARIGPLGSSGLTPVAYWRLPSAALVSGVTPQDKREESCRATAPLPAWLQAPGGAGAAQRSRKWLWALAAPSSEADRSPG